MASTFDDPPQNSLGEIARSFSVALGVLGQIDGREADVVIIPDGTVNLTSWTDTTEERRW
jgi:hypothetical protein